MIDKEKREQLKTEILDLHVNKLYGYNQILEELIMRYADQDMYDLAQVVTVVIGRPKATKLILKKDINVDINVENSPFIIKFETPVDNI